MIIEFNIERSDCRAAYRYINWSYRPFRYMNLSVPFLAVIPVMLMTRIELMPRLLLATAAVLASAIIYSIVFLFYIWLLGFMPSKNGGVLGPHSITLTTDGIIESTPVNKGTHSWQAVTNIDENKNYIFLVIGRIMIHIIPKRAFPNPQLSIEFINRAQDLYHSATSSVSQS